MRTFKNNIVKQYEGYFKTPTLWHGELYGLNQYEHAMAITPKLNLQIDPKLRLGKRVERFFSHDIKKSHNINIVLENTQIIVENKTIGELDFIIEEDGSIKHIEVVYKFYLIDTSIGHNEIEHCVGPNKKDSLLLKLNKLKNKQLPLLYHQKTKQLLKKLNIAPNTTISQYVFFKAELFLPYKGVRFSFEKLNENCVNGYYLHLNDLSDLSACKFYIPQKTDWIKNIDLMCDWDSYLKFYFKIKEFLNQQVSPLIWIKFPNGEATKMFVIWW